MTLADIPRNCLTFQKVTEAIKTVANSMKRRAGLVLKRVGIDCTRTSDKNERSIPRPKKETVDSLSLTPPSSYMFQGQLLFTLSADYYAPMCLCDKGYGTSCCAPRELSSLLWETVKEERKKNNNETESG